MTSELVLAVLGVVVSIALEAVPGLADWWAKWEWKRLVWLVGSFVVAFAAMGLAYAGAPVGFEPPGAFIWDGLFSSILSAIAAFTAGQVTYSVASRNLRPTTGK